MAQKRSASSRGGKSKANSGSAKARSKASGGKLASKRSTPRKGKLKVSVTKKQAEKMALLQLRVGRASHQYSMLAAFALAASGVFLLLTPSGRSLEGIPEDAKLLLPWLSPVVAGALIAAFAFHLKWKPYAGDRKSPHFLMTVYAFLTAIIILLLLVNQSLEGVDPSGLAWLYPSALSGISLTLISLAMTWRGWGRRKLASVLSAALPMALMVYGFTPIFSTGIPPDLLILTFMGSAVAILFSGSMLHIIASSTSVHRREMIRVSNDKLHYIKGQVEAKAEALDYKEDALRSREADLEVQEEAVTAKIRALEEGRKEFEALQAVHKDRIKEIREAEKEIRTKEADIATREETLALTGQEVAEKEATFDKNFEDLSKREDELSKQENVVKKALIDVREREKDAARKSREVKRLEKEQAQLKADLDRRKREVLDLEGQLTLRERAVALKEEGIGLRGRKAGAAARLARLEAKLLERERSLSQREVELKVAEERNASLDEKTQDAVERAKARLHDIQARERALTSQEKDLAERETKLESRGKDIQRQLKLLEHSVEKVREKEIKYRDLYKTAHSKASSVTELQRDLQAKIAATQEREAHLDALSKRLEKEHEEITARRKEVLKLKKDLEAREAEVKLKVMEREREFKQSLRGPADVDILSEKERALHIWEKRLRKKEEEMKALLYRKEKEFKERERAIQEGLHVEVEEEIEAVVDEDRVRSGTPRLDDLLLGGIPMGSQVLFVGPPFVGKEIGILNFIAEGLKNGAPCVIITTSRPPSEISKEMGPILPSFREYEQLGLVWWIDGSTPMPEGSSKSPIVKGNTYVVQSAGDFEGIMKALNKIEKEVDEEDSPDLRLAYMTLSTSLTQGNEKDGLKFVQRMVNRLRNTRSVAIYAIERGMHSDQQVEAIEHQMDGAIHFRVDGQKNQLSVAGICDVQTRDWVDYKHTNRALMIGSFMLERIR